MTWVKTMNQGLSTGGLKSENFIQNYIDESSEFDHILYVARDGHAIDYFFYEKGLK